MAKNGNISQNSPYCWPGRNPITDARALLFSPIRQMGPLLPCICALFPGAAHGFQGAKALQYAKRLKFFLYLQQTGPREGRRNHFANLIIVNKKAKVFGVFGPKAPNLRPTETPPSALSLSDRTKQQHQLQQRRENRPMPQPRPGA
ncbi:MAG: hypothetical protein ACRBBK_06645 [Paracoccaceae bacterium]